MLPYVKVGGLVRFVPGRIREIAMASPYLEDGKWYLRWKDDSARWRGMVSTARTKAEARRLQAELHGHLTPGYLRTEVDRLSFGPAVARFATPVLRAVRGEKKLAENSSKNPEEFPACGLERETGFEPATLSLGS